MILTMTIIDGIIEPPHAGWDRYIDNSLDTNRVWERTPDGEYLAVDEFNCYLPDFHNSDAHWQEGDAPCQFVYSTTKVTVKGGMFDLEQLLAAAKELKEKTHYWGVYLEGVQWVNIPGDKKKRCAPFAAGDETTCGRHMAEDMTPREKALWANGLLMLSWGS